MPPPSKIDLLPEDVRRELDERIVANGFGGYVALSEWLAEHGYEIGKSTVGAYGKDLSRHIARVRASTQAAIALEESTRDDTDARSNAIYAQLQSGIFDALTAIDDAEEEPDPAQKLVLYTKAGKDFAAIGRGNIARQRWAAEVRKNIAAALEALKREGFDTGTLAEAEKRISIYLPANNR